MDPIIRAATVTAARRPLRRPGQDAVTFANEPVGSASSVAPVADVDPAPVMQELPPTIDDLRAEADAALAHARALLASAERDAVRRSTELAEAKQRLDAQAADLARREEALQAAQRHHEREVVGAHEVAAKRGYEEGLARGMTEGKGTAQAAGRQRLAQLDAMASALSAAATAAMDAQEDMLVELAWTAICRLAGEVAASRDGALAMVRTALAQAGAARGARVRVHPDDAPWLQSELRGERDWSLVADATVAMGGCIVDDDHGELDARLELQLDRLRATLRDARAARARQGAA